MRMALGVSNWKLQSISLILLCSAYRAAAQTATVTFTNRQGTVYENVHVVKISEAGLIFTYTTGAGGGTLKLSELPDDVLRKFGYDPAQASSHDRETAKEQVNRELDRMVAAGYFREVEGVVYDLRKPQAGWVTYQNVKLIQRVDGNAALVVPQGRGYYDDTVLHVKNLAEFSDSQVFSFRAKLVGTYRYINGLDLPRVVSSYDAGRPCGRNDIPEKVLRGEVAFARISSGSESLNEVLSASDADSLTATGTGFFITKDGYLVTNNHVVKGAKRLRIRVQARTLDARVVKTSKAFDLAVLKVEGTFEPLPLDFERQMSLGDAVFTIGFPNVDVQGAAPKYTDGKVSSLSGMEDDPSQYQVSVPIQPGNSGGPLVADNGAVVGIVRAKLNDLTALEASGSVPQNVNYAVKAKYLKDLLETIPGIVQTIKTPAAEIKKGSAVEAAQGATVIVLVY